MESLEPLDQGWPKKLKNQAMHLAHTDARIGSFANLLRVAVTYYLRDYKAAKGMVDDNVFPMVKK